LRAGGAAERAAGGGGAPDRLSLGRAAMDSDGRASTVDLSVDASITVEHCVSSMPQLANTGLSNAPEFLRMLLRMPWSFRRAIMTAVPYARIAAKNAGKKVV
jgi:hypothetical protein